MMIVGGIYSQYPSWAIGPNATVVSISKITPAAPPCITPFMFPNDESISKENSTVAIDFEVLEVALRSFATCITWASKPTNAWCLVMK